MRALQLEKREFPVRFLHIKQVLEITGLGRSSIYVLPSFPKPVKVPGIKRTMWVESEVLAFMQQLMNDRDAEDSVIESNPPASTGWVTGEAAVRVLESNPDGAGVAK